MDGGRFWIANQQRNGHIVLLNSQSVSKFQEKLIEQTWKVVTEGNFEVNSY